MNKRLMKLSASYIDHLSNTPSFEDMILKQMVNSRNQGMRDVLLEVVQKRIPETTINTLFELSRSQRITLTVQGVGSRRNETYILDGEPILTVYSDKIMGYDHNSHTNSTVLKMETRYEILI